MDIFKDNKPTFHQWELELGLHKKANIKKTAEETTLGDVSDNWQTEVASSASSSLPYLADYSVNVMLDKVNQDSNSAYGNLEIKNKFDAPNLNKDDRSVRVPLIVEDKKLKPLDIMNIDGKMYPLSEAKLRQSLFRPEIAELSDRQPSKDRYIGYQSAPPYGGGQGGFSYGGDGKFASILDKIHIDEKDKLELANKLASGNYESIFAKNPAFAACIDKIASYQEEEEIEDVDCIRFDKLNKKEVLVKWASANNFQPKQVKLSTYEAAKFAGEGESSDQIFALEPGGSLTLTTNAVQKNTLDQDEVKEITEFGEYNVQDVEDRDLLGWVIPLITFDGVAVPSYLFTNGSVWAFQDRVSGSRVGQGSNLPSHLPQGLGIFYSTDSGKVLGTLPVEVSHSEGDTYVCQDQLGNQFSLEKLDIQTIVKMEEGHYAIPASMKFLRLPQEFTTLKEDGATFNKTATADLTVLTKHADDLYSLRGYLTHEIPHEELTKGDVEFMLYTAGFDGSDLVKKADKEKIVKIADGTPLSRRMEKMKKRLGKTASSHSSFLALKREVDVVKLASAFSDEETIDKILSLGVLNSDNISKFSDYLPGFEEVEQKLAELLFGIRCGLSPVQEEHASLAMNHIGKLIQGLRALKEKTSLQNKEQT